MILNSCFLPKFVEKLLQESMPFLRHLFSCFRVHKSLQPQQLIVKMLQGFLHGSSVFTAIGKCPRDPDSAHGVQTVRVLYNFPLQGKGSPSFVAAE